MAHLLQQVSFSLHEEAFFWLKTQATNSKHHSGEPFSCCGCFCQRKGRTQEERLGQMIEINCNPMQLRTHVCATEIIHLYVSQTGKINSREHAGTLVRLRIRDCLIFLGAALCPEGTTRTL